MKVVDRLVESLAMRWLKGKVKDLRRSTNMTTASKVLKFLDGWKLMIGVTAVFAVKVWDGMNNGHAGDIIGNVLSILGWLPSGDGLTGAGMAAAVASAVTVIGYGSKLWKAQAQARAGTSASELLSAGGYIKAAAKK